ncbi:lysophospholipid acyltransferase family protein [Arhodomonas aquaeolei]|uniref:lysophospholipid acyltransferase family protein n=1 Tax=Arhodomonas aquaeolei TaxID=2369 RepID=UPI002169FC9E|nr:lysophospholipid acyltransferase family protein [Arhodomonas aquaeolei]MCS4503028.1 lysophospholipid acyltransferase family protein [Arhodomonas aquaeolei]
MLRARLVDGLLRLTARLPLRLLHGAGRAVGTLADGFPNDVRRIVRVNVELCFPALPPAAKRTLARRALQSSACNLLELGAIWHRPVTETLALIREVDGEAVFTEALSEGRGVLIIAPHLGAWELLQAWVAQRTPLHALYRPPRQAWLESLLVAARSRTGAHFHPARAGGVRALLRALRDGEGVGILPDQQPPGEGVHVPFFGQPAKTMTLFGRIAERSGAPVVIGWAERLPAGRGFRVHWRRADPAVADPDPATAATALNRTIEAAIREQPEQYLWSYRRFSRQPEGVRNPYKRFADRGRWLVER